MFFRKVGEAYHKTPAELEELTYDQLWIMGADIETLKSTAIREVTTDDLRAMGTIPQVKAGEPRSYVQRIKAQQIDDAQRQKREGKRERRRQARRDLIEARRRGEV